MAFLLLTAAAISHGTDGELSLNLLHCRGLVIQEFQLVKPKMVIFIGNKDYTTSLILTPH